MGSTPRKGSSLRQLPSIDQLINTPQAEEAIRTYGRPLTLDALRFSIDEARRGFAASGSIPEKQTLLENMADHLSRWTAATLRQVINATGVIIHTNLGRAPLSRAALAAVTRLASAYTDLEFDLETGRRGSRLANAENALIRLTGAEAALVVNNNAAAVLLALSALAKRRKVIIARSQLVEIGGGFRVPEVLSQSGARLLEIGTTNRVHLRDYEAGLEESPAAILRVHRSNFQIVGFASEPDLKEICELAHRQNLPVIDDLGSGSLLETSRYGLGHEPMIQESLRDGADLVCFSGDKLLGGPQAGILVGRKDLVARLRKHPLARAVRADKLCLAALSETLNHYLKDEAEVEIPVWRMIAASEATILERAAGWAERLGLGEIIAGRSTVGGGSLPGETLPTWLLAIRVDSPDRVLGSLRRADPPVIARIEGDRVLLDPRTVLAEQEGDLLKILGSLAIDGAPRGAAPKK